MHGVCLCDGAHAAGCWPFTHSPHSVDSRAVCGNVNGGGRELCVLLDNIRGGGGVCDRVRVHAAQDWTRRSAGGDSPGEKVTRLFGAVAQGQHPGREARAGADRGRTGSARGAFRAPLHQPRPGVWRSPTGGCRGRSRGLAGAAETPLLPLVPDGDFPRVRVPVKPVPGGDVDVPSAQRPRQAHTVVTATVPTARGGCRFPPHPEAPRFECDLNPFRGNTQLPRETGQRGKNRFTGECHLGAHPPSPPGRRLLWRVSPGRAVAHSPALERAAT